VLDMKGGLLVAHAALTALSEVGALADLPLGMVSVGDEELGSPDSRSFVQAIARGAAAGLVFEAGRAEDAIITQRKGTGKFKVEAIGKASHAGNFHHEGINAIRALARFVDQFEALTDYDRGVTINVGTISGGSSANTVPARAECFSDFRFVRASDGEDVVRAVDRIARQVGEATGARFQVEGGIRRAPLERSPASVELYERYAACAEQAGLGSVECPLIGGGSDANTVSAVGVPTIDGLGPRGRHFHTTDEYIEISSLVMRVEALIRLLLG
jgi:glutamate carboxypeptidase